ncbi:MAG: CcmD family protein [Chitinophagales bacterium]
MNKLWRGISNKFFLLLGTLTICFVTTAQNNSGYEGPEMATGFYAEGKIFIVIGVVAIILTGIILYLVRIDRKISKLENEVNKK